MVKYLVGGGAGCWGLRTLPLSLPSSKGLKPKPLLSSVGLGVVHMPSGSSAYWLGKPRSHLQLTDMVLLSHSWMDPQRGALVNELMGSRTGCIRTSDNTAQGHTATWRKGGCSSSTWCDVCSDCDSHIGVFSLAVS